MGLINCKERENGSSSKIDPNGAIDLRDFDKPQQYIPSTNSTGGDFSSEDEISSKVVLNYTP